MYEKKASLGIAAAVFLAFAMLGGVSPAAANTPIVFADLGWDSVQVHNRIAGFGSSGFCVPGG